MADHSVFDFTRLADQISQQDLVEWAGLITGVLYVILATYEKPSCWLFGIFSSACIAWKSFTDYFLIADGILQLFYMAIGVVGLLKWIRGASANRQKPIITSSVVHHGIAIGLCLLISWPISFVLISYADARYGYPDTVLTFLSVWATILLVRKDLHNWIYWIFIDLVYIFLYWKTGGFLFALLFLIYAILSIHGLRLWRKHLKETFVD